jgi:hypothetical protein
MTVKHEYAKRKGCSATYEQETNRINSISTTTTIAKRGENKRNKYKIKNFFYYFILLLYISMPTRIKQLKVINNATLALDGAFSIGLRDNLVIKPNSQVALSKFLYQESPPFQTAINLGETSFLFTPNALSVPFRSTATTTRKVTVEKGIFSSASSLIAKMNTEVNAVLSCGDTSGRGLTFSDFVKQRPAHPTIDNGLDIIFTTNNSDGFVELDFYSTKIVQALGENAPNVTNPNMLPVSAEDGVGSVGVEAEDLTQFWGVWDANAVVKGAFQFFTQINQEGKIGVDYQIGLRYMDDETTGNVTPMVMSLYRDPEGQWNILDGAEGGETIPYEWAAGDFVIFFTSNGSLYLQIYAGNPDSNGIISANAVGALKYSSRAFAAYELQRGSSWINYRPMIVKGGNTPDEPFVEGDAPYFRQLYWTTRNYERGGQLEDGSPRCPTIDFTQAGQLAGQIGMGASTYNTNELLTWTQFLGTQVPNFYRIQDLALFWSLPAQTYVGNQTKTRNGRENMIASFTPSRQLTSTDNLFFQEQLEYTDIGNLDTMNISTIQFRVVNEFPNGNTPVVTNYLSFVLFIKEEY